IASRIQVPVQWSHHPQHALSFILWQLALECVPDRVPQVVQKEFSPVFPPRKCGMQTDGDSSFCFSCRRLRDVHAPILPLTEAGNMSKRLPAAREDRYDNRVARTQQLRISRTLAVVCASPNDDAVCIAPRCFR